MASVLQGTRFAPITSNDQAGSIWISAILCLVYSVLVVAVRVHLRRKIYGMDDYLILAATVRSPASAYPGCKLIFIEFGHLAEAIAIFVGLKHGVGRTVSLLRTNDVSEASEVN